eukprot:3885898-Rhodomonas_salina.1
MLDSDAGCCGGCDAGCREFDDADAMEGADTRGDATARWPRSSGARRELIEGAKGDSFTMGSMPVSMKIPTANVLFPELLAALMLLEHALTPGASSPLRAVRGSESVCLASWQSSLSASHAINKRVSVQVRACQPASQPASQPVIHFARRCVRPSACRSVFPWLPPACPSTV